jgi:hypothetical protein
MSATEDIKRIREEHTRMLDHADIFLKLHPYLNELMHVLYFQCEHGEAVELGCYKDVDGFQRRFEIAFLAFEEFCYSIHVSRPGENGGRWYLEGLASFNEPVSKGETPSKVPVTSQQLIGLLQKEGFLDHLTAYEHAELIAGNLQMIPERPSEW